MRQVRGAGRRGEGEREEGRAEPDHRGQVNERACVPREKKPDGDQADGPERAACRAARGRGLSVGGRCMHGEDDDDFCGFRQVGREKWEGGRRKWEVGEGGMQVDWMARTCVPSPLCRARRYISLPLAGRIAWPKLFPDLGSVNLTELRERSVREVLGAGPDADYVA